jgi:release factor glutamine methyltransferase
MPETETWTIGRLLQWTTGYLKERGADSPRLDAEVLLAEALGCRRIELYTTFGETPEEAARTAFRELVRRRAEGAPVAYLVGRREFYSLSFRVTPDVLIPRPETEFLVIRLLDLAGRQSPAGERWEIADVGAGSGIIAICAAKRLENSRVTAVDISPAALKVAQGNAAEHAVGERIEFVESDLFSAVPAERRFDFIVSNPPYVARADPHLASGDLRFEPPAALSDGSVDGLDSIRAVVAGAPDHLEPGGWLMIEHGYDQKDAVQALLERHGFGEKISIDDLAGIPRVACGRIVK